MIRLLLAGPREFTDRVQRRAKEQPDIRIISLTTEPSHTVEAIEDNVNSAEAVLLGFPDDEIKLMIDIATRNEVKGVIFVSADNPAVAYRKWARYKCKLVRMGHELSTIANYFTEQPELSYDNDSTKRQDIANIFNESAPDNIITDQITGPQKARVDEVRRREQSNRAVAIKQTVITVFGPKGGIGKTVISVSMAKSLAMLTDLNVVVLDLDTTKTYGDVLRHFGYIGGPCKDTIICDTGNRHSGMAEKTLVAWLNFPWGLSAERMIVDDYLICLHKNLYCLPPFRMITEENSIDYTLVQKVIGVLRRHFDVVIIDSGNNLNKPTLSAMENCDEIIIVSSPERGVLDNLSEFTYDILRVINKTKDPLIVINKVFTKTPYKLSDLVPKITGGYPLTVKLPYDQGLYEKVANNASVPNLGGEPTPSPFLEEIEKLLCHIFPRELFYKKNQENKRGLLKKLFGFSFNKRKSP